MKVFNSTNLKVIGIISMFIDHFAWVLYFSDYRFYFEDLYNLDLEVTYVVMRMIGRLAFPIFAFLIAQGYFYTRNVKQYMIRLSIFALISEVFFDLAFTGKYLEFSHQNIFFTLAIGLLAIYLYDHFKEKELPVLSFLSLVGSCGLALVLMTDYNFIGVLMIFFFYFYKENKKVAIIGFSIMNGIMVLGEIAMVITSNHIFPFQIAGFLALFFILNYNNKKGRNLKYLFYIFYPGHLFLLYVLEKVLNQSIS